MLGEKHQWSLYGVIREKVTPFSHPHRPSFMERSGCICETLCFCSRPRGTSFSAGKVSHSHITRLDPPRAHLGLHPRTPRPGTAWLAWPLTTQKGALTAKRPMTWSSAPGWVPHIYFPHTSAVMWKPQAQQGELSRELSVLYDGQHQPPSNSLTPSLAREVLL